MDIVTQSLLSQTRVSTLLPRLPNDLLASQTAMRREGDHTQSTIFPETPWKGRDARVSKSFSYRVLLCDLSKETEIKTPSNKCSIFLDVFTQSLLPLKRSLRGGIIIIIPRESEDAPQSYTMAKRKSSDSSDLLAENSKHFPLQNRVHEVSGEGGGKDRRIHLKQPWSLRKDWLEMRILFPHQQRMKTLPGTSYQISAILNLPSH